MDDRQFVAEYSENEVEIYNKDNLKVTAYVDTKDLVINWYYKDTLQPEAIVQDTLRIYLNNAVTDEIDTKKIYEKIKEYFFNVFSNLVIEYSNGDERFFGDEIPSTAADEVVKEVLFGLIHKNLI